MKACKDFHNERHGQYPLPSQNQNQILNIEVPELALIMSLNALHWHLSIKCRLEMSTGWGVNKQRLCD